MENESIEAKQLYLRQNIIDAGFDAEKFVEYCSTQHQLEDLGDWTMDKLKRVVQLYVQIEKTNESKQSAQKQEDDDNDWCNFQEAPSTPPVQANQTQLNEVKKQPQVNHNHTKTGHVVFSQDDWAIFLGVSSSQPVTNLQKPLIPVETLKMETISDIQKKPQQPKKTTQALGSEIKSINSPSKQLQKQKSSIETIEKQNPLSPPSQDSKKQPSTIKSNADQGVLKNQNRGPINFTNLRLQTSKLKPMPKLPQINDIVITKTEQVSRNFLQSDYTMYNIHFLPGNHTIKRKFADLRKLRSLLHGFYPHIRLPFLEPEGWLTSSQGKDTETLAKYKWMVLDFLKYVTIRNEQLQNCPLVRKFCGFTTNIKSSQPYQETSKAEVKKLLQAYENISKPKNIGQICLTNNFILLPPTNDGQKVITNTTSLMWEIDHEYGKLNKKFQTLFYYYDCIAKALGDVSGSFQTLENLIKKYNFDNGQAKEYRVYDGIREMCSKMENSMNQQCVIFKTRIKNILRFQKDNITTLKQLFDSRNKIHHEYSKQGYPILSKSSQSGKSEVQIESSIPIQQPCRNNKNMLCVQQVFWSHFVKVQISSYFEQIRKKINQQLTMISYQELDNQNDNLNFWNSMIKKCVV